MVTRTYWESSNSASSIGRREDGVSCRMRRRKLAFAFRAVSLAFGKNEAGFSAGTDPWIEKRCAPSPIVKFIWIWAPWEPLETSVGVGMKKKANNSIVELCGNMRKTVLAKVCSPNSLQGQRKDHGVCYRD